MAFASERALLLINQSINQSINTQIDISYSNYILLCKYMYIFGQYIIIRVLIYHFFIVHICIDYYVLLRVYRLLFVRVYPCSTKILPTDYTFLNDTFQHALTPYKRIINDLVSAHNPNIITLPSYNRHNTVIIPDCTLYCHLPQGGAGHNKLYSL